MEDLIGAPKYDVQDKPDPVNPDHYKGDAVMRIIEEFDLGFCEGNSLKYLLRYKKKNGLEDLKKCRWYLDRRIKQMEAEEKMADESIKINKEKFLSL